MRNIYLIRHGITEANEKQLYCGSTDLPLSEDGLTGLAGLCKERTYPDIAGIRVYTSGMLRAEETLLAIYGEIEHEQMPDFREMDFGTFEMRSYEGMKNEPAYLEWISGENEMNRCPEGESGVEMARRVLCAFEKLLETAGDLLIIAHGGPIAAIMRRLFPQEGRNRYDWQPKSGMGYAVLFDGGVAIGYAAIP